MKRTNRMKQSRPQMTPEEKAHMELVHAQQCIVSQAYGVVAHHLREAFPRQGGLRVNHFLTVPLRPDLHDGAPYSLHARGQKADELGWWLMHQIDPVLWLRHFLRRHYPTPSDVVRAAHEAIDQAINLRSAPGS